LAAAVVEVKAQATGKMVAVVVAQVVVFPAVVRLAVAKFHRETQVAQVLTTRLLAVVVAVVLVQLGLTA
jgi:hypothetical protein